MAFPGTYNFSYYKGDTYQFLVFPKDSSGNIFDLSSFTSSKFTLATKRGTASASATGLIAIVTAGEKQVELTYGTTADIKIGQKISKVIGSGPGRFAENAIVESITSNSKFTVSANHTISGSVAFGVYASYDAVASISSDKSHVVCEITPTVAKFLDASLPYVYDVQVSNDSETYTLLNGNITISEEITLPRITEPDVVIAGPPQSLTAIEDPDGTIKLDWLAPNSGSPATAYKIYGSIPALSIPYTLVDTVDATDLTYSANTILGQPLADGIEYLIKITSYNTAGENTDQFATASITLGA
jgi:hypothetical protein